LKLVDHPNIIRIIDSALRKLVCNEDGPLSRHLARFKARTVESLEAFRPLVEAVASLHKIPLVTGRERYQLDTAVWEIRRYCRPFDPSTLGEVIAEIEASNQRPPHRFKLKGGLLEDILANRKHPARPALIWSNRHFTSRFRKRIRLGGLHAENAPLTLYPEMIDEVCKYALLPRQVIHALGKR
jgi:hypothetical protein